MANYAAKRSAGRGSETSGTCSAWDRRDRVLGGSSKNAGLGLRVRLFRSAATAIYLLLRKVEDGTEVNEVTLDEEHEQFRLPPLKNDGLGVPAVTDVPPPSAPRTRRLRRADSTAATAG